MIEYFELRPPKVAALRINTGQSVGALIEQLRAFPGVHSVTVEARSDDSLVYTLDTGSGEPARISASSDGSWLVAVIQEVDDYFQQRVIEVKKIDDCTLQRMYQRAPLGVS